jgi:PAS domain S-box-containing protein
MQSRSEAIPAISNAAVVGVAPASSLPPADEAAASADSLRLALEAGRIGTWSLDSRTGALSCSPLNRELFGFDPDGPMPAPESWTERIHPDDREGVLAAWAGALSRCVPVTAEYRIVLPDGSVRWLDSRARPECDADGATLRVTGVNMDVTERRLAEERLRETNERLQRAQAAARLGTWEWDLVTDRVVWSEGIYSLLGLPPGSTDASFRRWEEFILPEDRPAVGATVARITAEPGEFSVEFRVRRTDGEVRWLACVGRAEAGSDGRPRRLLGVNIDVTDRKQAEIDLARRAGEQSALFAFTDRLHRATSLDALYDSALDSILGALRCDRASILIFDEAGVMRFVAWRGLSDAYRAAVDGHSPWGPEEPNPVPFGIDDVAAAGLEDSLRAAIQSEGIGALGFVPLVADQRLVGKFMIYYDAPHAFTADELALALTVGRQLAFGVNRQRAEAERRRTEEALRRSEERYRSLMQAITSVVWTSAPDGRFTTPQPSWSAYTGQSWEACRDFGWLEAVHPADRERLLAAWRAAVEAKASYSARGRMWHAGTESYRHFEVRAVPILEPDGAVREWVGKYLDVDDRTRAEEGLREHQREIEELNRRLRRAMRETHHRVKNNLQLIGAMIDMRVMDGSETLPIQEVRRLGQTVNTLAAVHDVLTEQARKDETAERVSAAAVLEKLVGLLRGSLRGCRLRTEIEDVSLTARQGTSLAIVVNELVSNAAKHAGADVAVELTRTDGRAALSVCDDGPGFPAGFDPRRDANTGLDLVENLCGWDLGGAVEYANHPEGGACVRVDFPLPGAADPTDAAAPASAPMVN